MTVRKQILAVLCTSVCCTSFILGASDVDLPFSSGAAGSAIIPEAPLAPKRKVEQVQEQEGPLTDDKDEEEDKNAPEDSPGPRPRRLEGGDRRPAKAVRGSGWGSLLM